MWPGNIAVDVVREPAIVIVSEPPSLFVREFRFNSEEDKVWRILAGERVVDFFGERTIPSDVPYHETALAFLKPGLIMRQGGGVARAYVKPSAKASLVAATGMSPTIGAEYSWTASRSTRLHFSLASNSRSRRTTASATSNSRSTTISCAGTSCGSCIL